MRLLSVAAAVILSVGCAGTQMPVAESVAPPADGAVRIAVYNIRELSTAKINRIGPTGVGEDPQSAAAAAIVQRIRPDVLVLLEVDHDYTDEGLPLETNAVRFVRNYLNRGADAIDYPYAWAGPCNTGMISGLDLDRDGVTATAKDQGRPFGNDSWGYGNYPGQYSMAVLSRLPLDAEGVRSFQMLKWKDLPGNHLPREFYGDAVADEMRLSSKSHWDLPVLVNGTPLHLLVTHPTPQGFDGPEDRNGARNFDELRLFKLYLDGEPSLVDDQGNRGGFAGEHFLLAGDFNADPISGSRYDDQFAATQLLAHPRLQDTSRRFDSAGAQLHGGSNPTETQRYHTFKASGDFGTTQIDYLLPSKGLKIVGGGVYWPSVAEDRQGAIEADAASDHRLLWIDLKLPK